MQPSCSCIQGIAADSLAVSTCDPAVAAGLGGDPCAQRGAVIRRCLDALFAGVAPGELDVVVVCNGCADDTAALARSSGHPVRVIESARRRSPPRCGSETRRRGVPAALPGRRRGAAGVGGAPGAGAPAGRRGRRPSADPLRQRGLVGARAQLLPRPLAGSRRCWGRSGAPVCTGSRRPARPLRGVPGSRRRRPLGGRAVRLRARSRSSTARRWSSVVPRRSRDLVRVLRRDVPRQGRDGAASTPTAARPRRSRRPCGTRPARDRRAGPRRSTRRRTPRSLPGARLAPRPAAGDGGSATTARGAAEMSAAPDREHPRLARSRRSHAVPILQLFALTLMVIPSDTVIKRDRRRRLPRRPGRHVRVRRLPRRRPCSASTIRCGTGTRSGASSACSGCPSSPPTC